MLLVLSDKALAKLPLLPHLSHLHIYSALMQSARITQAIFNIRSLKSLKLYSIDPIIFHFGDAVVQPLSELEYLQVDCCYLTQLLELLKYVGPNVKRMKIYLAYQSEPDVALIEQMRGDHRIPGKLSLNSTC